MNRTIADVIEDLHLTQEQIKDKDIGVFAMQVSLRKKSGDWYQYWNGNGFIEINKKDGTSIRTILDDKPYKAEFPENMDVEISKEFLPLYDYMNRRLVEANLQNDVAIIEEVEGLITEFRDTWKEVIQITRQQQFAGAQQV